MAFSFCAGFYWCELVEWPKGDFVAFWGVLRSFMVECLELTVLKV